jgi:hypothetical protein
MKVAVRPYTPATLTLPGDISFTHICQRFSLSRGHSDAGRIKPMKNPTELIRKQTCDLTASSAVPQSTVLLCTPLLEAYN